MKKTLISIALAAGAWMAAPAGAAVLSFSPSSSHVAVGDSVTIDVSISGLGNEILSAYDLNFRYNPAIASNNTATIYLSELGGSDVLADLGDPPDPLSYVDGNLGFWANSLLSDNELDALQGDGFQLFSFSFTGAADGVTNLTLGSDLDFERLFVGRNALPLDVQVGSACIAVGQGSCQNVPEPESLLGLALAGGLLLSAWRRRQSSSRPALAPFQEG